MKLLILVIFLAECSASPQEKLDPVDLAFDRSELAFKEKYHGWAAAIYAHPQIILSSKSHTYTDIPEFTEIIALDRLVIPHIAKEIENNTDFSLFLGTAILKIMDWNPADFKGSSVQDQNRSIIQRLRADGIIPAKQDVTGNGHSPVPEH